MTDSVTLSRFEKQHLSKFLWPSNFKQKFVGRFGILEVFNELPTGSRVCDFGSGTGRLTPYLVNKKFKVTNFEPTTARNLVSNRITKSEWEQVTLVSDSETLKDNSFDLVVSIGVIHHLRNPVSSLNEMKRIAKCNTGQIVVWVYAKQNTLLQFVIDLIRRFTSRFPHLMNLILSTSISIVFFSGKFFFKKLRIHVFNQINEYSFRDLNLMIYDQLQPPYSKYFLKKELVDLMCDIGIEDFKLIKGSFGFTIIFKNE